MADVEEVEVVVAHHERATLRVGDVFLKIDADQTRTDVEVEAMAMAQPLSPSNRPTASASQVVADHPWEKTPLILSALEALVVPETAGDPMSTQKWVRSSLRTLSERLKEAGHALSPPTVSRLLRKLDY